MIQKWRYASALFVRNKTVCAAGMSAFFSLKEISYQNEQDALQKGVSGDAAP